MSPFCWKDIYKRGLIRHFAGSMGRELRRGLGIAHEPFGDPFKGSRRNGGGICGLPWHGAADTLRGVCERALLNVMGSSHHNSHHKMQWRTEKIQSVMSARHIGVGCLVLCSCVPVGLVR